MTTIVCTPTIMASDSVASDDVSVNVRKIFRVNKGLLGVSGPYAYGYGLYQYLLDEGPKPIMKDLTALYIDGEKIWCYDEHLQPYVIEDGWAAIGTGAMAALAAMHMGATPLRAVEIAMLLDPWSGGTAKALQV